VLSRFNSGSLRHSNAVRGAYRGLNRRRLLRPKVQGVFCLEYVIFIPSKMHRRHIVSRGTPGSALTWGAAFLQIHEDLPPAAFFFRLFYQSLKLVLEGSLITQIVNILDSEDDSANSYSGFRFWVAEILANKFSAVHIFSRK